MVQFKANTYTTGTDYDWKKRAVFLHKLEQMKGLILDNTLTFIVRPFNFNLPTLGRGVFQLSLISNESTLCRETHDA